ncbi:MAG: hypothetical protein R3B96_09020 [Pirellulaceae bacterium]
MAASAAIGGSRSARQPPNAIERPRIDRPISTGVQSYGFAADLRVGAADAGDLRCRCRQERLLGMMARDSSADVNVIALIGERGREVNDFLERDLGPEGIARSVVVVATGINPRCCGAKPHRDRPPLIAEYFRDQGANGRLMMDSLTRFAMAQRGDRLGGGEPPTTRGYPPSVFSLLPRLVERAGRSALGSITAFYSVLVEGDDPSEPVAGIRSAALDGHTCT